MRVHSISVFADKSLTAHFSDLFGNKSTVVLRLQPSCSTTSSPDITIFFDNPQEAVNFKNDVIQSWETFLKKEAKEKS